MPYELSIDNLSLASRWPALAGRSVQVGGVTVTYSEARSAAVILAASRTSAIAPVLAAAGHPLARCDYFAAAAPYLAEARRAPKTGRAGAAGRHVTKNAFIDCVTAELRRAERSELARALGAFGTDERYAAAIAREAVAIRERLHAAGVRQRVRTAVTSAVAACAASRGQFSCALASACGTGQCRFAPPELAGPDVAAPPGRLPRPANHLSQGQGFGDGAAVAAVLEARPYRVAVQAA